jgi:hypothetical protein
MATSRQDVAHFLLDFKAALTLEHVRWVSREDQAKAPLSGLEVTRNQAVNCLKELTPDNYSKGPDPDDFQDDQEVWVFGMDVLGVEAYIKVALQQDSRRRSVRHALIWSFHKAEYPMRYPIKGA